MALSEDRRRMVDAVVKSLEISVEDMEKISRLLKEACEEGLRNEDTAVVKMFLTYVHSLPTRSEEGDFLALDLGGSTFRVLKLTLEKGGKMPEDKVQCDEMEIPKKKMTGTQEDLFDYIVDKLAEFMKKYGISPAPDSQLPLGFTFSFPVKQSSLTAGTLKRWTKEFNASGAIGKDVIGMLQSALDKRKLSVDVVALLNDTTATLLAVACEDPDCHVGLILGTGSNACYLEKTEAIPKFEGDRKKDTEVIINCEYGAFGEDEVLDEWLRDFDREVHRLKEDVEDQKVHCLKEDVEDQKDDSSRKQIFEKLISGKYLGPITHAALLKLVKDGVLKVPQESTFRKLAFGCFETMYLSRIEGKDGLTQCKDIFKQKFGIEISDADYEIVRRVCEAVSTRAARLAATGIVTLVRKIGKVEKCTVAVDGSVYKKYPEFRQRMRDAIDDLVPGNGIEMKISQNGSGKGAAVVAAMACRPH